MAAEVERAKQLHAAGRLVAGFTRRTVEALSCDLCRADGRETAALVVGRARSGKTDVRMCADHFAQEGLGLGAELGQVLLQPGPSALIEVPPDTEPAGYARAILEFGLPVTTPHKLTFIASRGAKRTIERDGWTMVVLPPTYRPAPGLAEHLAFALKYDGVNLEVLSALFERVELDPFERALGVMIAAHPTGQYVRRVWFLYEFLTGRRLPADDLKVGNYVPLLDDTEYYTSRGTRSPRHRILDNLLGTNAFCPIVRRTKRLAEFEAKRLGEEAANIAAEFDDDAIKRAVSYLYTKETRSSFSIEGERPSSSKMERFIAFLKSVPRLAALTREELVRLQGEAVDPRFAEGGYRRSQVYVAEPVDLTRQRIHFIAPRPEDVPSMMEGLLACHRRIDGPSIDAVVQAAVIAFGFVFVHPFEDGNGRIHRLLVHYVLSRTGFTPRGVIFPVSAVMLERRHEYDEALEAFSVPLMRLVDYDEREDGVVTVRNATAHLYRYFDATPMAEALYGWVEQTVREEFRRELEFVVAFRDIRQAMDSIVEMPDKHANLFVRLCLQNRGRLPEGRRERHFAMLKDEEVAALESVVQSHLGQLTKRAAKPTDAAPAGGFRRTGPPRVGS